MDFLTLTQSNWFIVGPVAQALGFIMNGIYEFLSTMNIASIGLSIIIFTVIVKMLMLPLSIKQQKFSKLNSIMMPELQQVQEKYKKLDKSSPKYQEMMLKQNEEMKEVYAKYGTSPTGGCLQLIIQMPILFALYQVIYKIPGYISKVRELYIPIRDALMNIPTYTTTEEFVSLAASNGLTKTEHLEDPLRLIDMLYNFDKTEWQKFTDIFPALQEYVSKALPSIEKVNYFLGLDLATPPSQQIWPGVIIPILAGLTQWYSSKMIQTQSNNSSEDTMGSTMKTMNIVMPLMSVFFCFTFSAGIGVYWIASAVVQIIVQLLVNKYMERIDIDEMVEKNIEKANAKRVKAGKKPLKAKPVISVKTIEEEQEIQKKKEEEAKEKTSEQIRKSTEYYERTGVKKGRLSSKAAMVQQYNEKNEKKKN